MVAVVTEAAVHSKLNLVIARKHTAVAASTKVVADAVYKSNLTM